MAKKNFKEIIAEVEALVFDVDGVLTDGGIIPLADGDFIRKYYAKDGYAIAYAVKHGYKICIISGGFGRMLESRMQRLGIEYTYLGCMDKIAAIHDFAGRTASTCRRRYTWATTFPTWSVCARSAFRVAPADACPEVLETAVYVSEYDGGKGAVRDIVEQVLRVQGKWALDAKGVIADDSKQAASR